ncbi:MAG: zinc ABC transporter substrate-binding protein [Gammaproteobacteria bacterium]|nr:zinc ABC transporter substrate-binding protein [Gammaproteobacteria bacterium]
MKYQSSLSVVLLGFFLSVPLATAEVRVFACEPEWGALSRELGGSEVTVVNATVAEQDPHHIQARPSLIAKIRRADLLVCTGAELEVGWLPLLLRKSANGAIQPGQVGHFMAAEQVELLGKPALIDRQLGDVHAAGNPHIQFDPHRLEQVARALTARLIEIDASHKAEYTARLQHFLSSWQKAVSAWESRAELLRGKTMVVQHKSWVYLSSWLGLKVVAALEPKPGIPPSGAHLAKVLSLVKKDKPDFIVHAGYQSEQASRWLAAKIDRPILSVPFSPAEDESLMAWYERVLGLFLAVAK